MTNWTDILNIIIDIAQAARAYFLFRDCTKQLAGANRPLCSLLILFNLFSVFTKPKAHEGLQQGDPLRPLLFCSTIHPLLQSLEANLNLGFLDDLTLGGPESVVADDVSKNIKEGEDLGLILNTSKCELITHRGFNVQSSTLC